MDNLNKQRTIAEDLARSMQIPFMLNYVKKYPNSFISLYILTKTGMEAKREDYKSHFILLDSK